MQFLYQSYWVDHFTPSVFSSCTKLHANSCIYIHHRNLYPLNSHHKKITPSSHPVEVHLNPSYTQVTMTLVFTLYISTGNNWGTLTKACWLTTCSLAFQRLKGWIMWFFRQVTVLWGRAGLPTSTDCIHSWNLDTSFWPPGLEYNNASPDLFKAFRRSFLGKYPPLFFLIFF